MIETLRRTFLRQSWKNPTLELVGRPNVTKANIDSFDQEHADEYTDNSHRAKTSLFRAASEKATAKLLNRFLRPFLFVLLQRFVHCPKQY